MGNGGHFRRIAAPGPVSGAGSSASRFTARMFPNPRGALHYFKTKAETLYGTRAVWASITRPVTTLRLCVLRSRMTLPTAPSSRLSTGTLRVRD